MTQRQLTTDELEAEVERLRAALERRPMMNAHTALCISEAKAAAANALAQDLATFALSRLDYRRLDANDRKLFDELEARAKPPAAQPVPPDANVVAVMAVQGQGAVELGPQSPTSDPGWLVKDFDVLYRAAQAASKAFDADPETCRLDTDSARKMGYLQGQLLRLAPAFDDIQSLKRRVPAFRSGQMEDALRGLIPKGGEGEYIGPEAYARLPDQMAELMRPVPATTCCEYHRTGGNPGRDCR